MDWIRVFESETEARQKLITGKPQLVTYAGRRISLVLFREIFYAVQDKCTHNGESLSAGSVNMLGEIICPWHGYRFRLLDGRACDSSCRDLKTYPVKIDSDGLYIGMN